MTDQDKTKPRLSDLRAAWRHQTDASPELSDAWLRAAMTRVSRKQARPTSMAPAQVLLGLALSAAASLLIFVSSNALTASRTSEPAAFEYYLNRSYLSSMTGGQQ